MGKPIKAYSLASLENLMAELKMPKFRAMQIAEWVYGKHARSYGEMTNLPAAMRENLTESHPLLAPEVVDKQHSSDGTRKYLLKFTDGALAETVALPAEDGRLTVCCSSQSGCAMRCAFCATGKAGLTRSLECGEIADQLIVVQEDMGERITNVVVMGQGEPFANYENVLAALRIINHPKLFGIGARHIAISTCGLTGGIARLAEEPEQFTLAVSLHSAIQEKRDELMPSMRNEDLFALKSALISYTEKTGRRFSFEYALMKGINDSEEDLSELISYCRSLLCHINLIPLNEVAGSSFEPVSPACMGDWRAALERAGIQATVRKSRGADIAGACGQLANRAG